MSTMHREDQELRARLAHMSDALSSPKAHITQRPSFIATCEDCQAQVGTIIRRLDAATQEAATDAAENKAVKAEFDAARAVALEEYGILYDEVSRLARPRRAKDRDPVQTAKHLAFFNRVMPSSPSKVADLRAAALVSFLQGVQSALGSAPAPLPAEDVASFTAAVQDLTAKRQAVVGEALDDAPILEALHAVRADANSVLVATRSILSGILRLEKNPLSVDEFISRRQAAAPKAPPPPADA